MEEKEKELKLHNAFLPVVLVPAFIIAVVSLIAQLRFYINPEKEALIYGMGITLAMAVIWIIRLIFEDGLRRISLPAIIIFNILVVWIIGDIHNLWLYAIAGASLLVAFLFAGRLQNHSSGARTYLFLLATIVGGVIANVCIRFALLESF